MRFFITIFFLWPMLLLAQEATDTIKKVEFPANYQSAIDIVYTGGTNWQKKLDIYYKPASNNNNKPTPIVINIHGGGWNKGNKESQTGFNTFFKAGFAVVNIAYRLTGEATAPAAVEDARCALLFTIKNAAVYNFDINKIVVMGGSAGGHLALMAGLLGNNHLFDSNCKGVENVKVAAIINKYGIVDVWDWAYGKIKTSKSATSWLGTKATDEAFAKSVSPLTWVTKNSPPVFIVHGDADPTVPYEHSVWLHKKLLDNGVQTQFITVPGGLHGKFDKDTNSKLNKDIINFIFSTPAFKN
jgi:acetyl esterase/lipase